MFSLFKKKKKTILVTDDDDYTASLLIMFLQGKGFELYRAKDGKEGVETARKLLPDLVLMDITMPRMNGFDALQIIKSTPETGKIPVIMCSDHSQIGDVEKCNERGASGYILKPFELERVFEKVKAVLGNK